MKLAGLNALITGGSQGLGRVIAETFVREGASVMLCARDAALLENARAELAALAQSGQKVFARACDVSSEQQVNDLAAHAIAEFGAVHVLVNNAGIYGPLGPTESVPLDEWRRAIEINLLGVLLPCRALIPHFKAAGRGKIIIISGGGATNPLPNISSYAASKAAVVRLMETLSEELKAHRIDVNAVAPGALKTRMMQEVLDAGPEKVGAAFYAKNVKWTEDGATPPALAANLCAYLASSESDGVTGRLISAQWDPWKTLHTHKDEFGDIYTLRRIVPEDRGKKWE
ncbi:MAG: SDR family NAD(P)-dependent oxidoreductase [Verrucomicrobia bacterium]|nr:SDR family NAD(P)-dependent oxidoreductase [Verrucomicrobiota bacterium]